jgi:hypothetical protein
MVFLIEALVMDAHEDKKQNIEHNPMGSAVPDGNECRRCRRSGTAAHN